MTFPPPLPCPQCGATVLPREEAPNRGSGCLVALIGLIFSPILIGVPIAIYGFVLMGKKRRYWHCTGCGRMFPA